MDFPNSNFKRQANPRPLRWLSPLHRATRRIQDHFRPRSRALGVPGTSAHIVSYLAGYGPVPVGRLVEVFGVKKSTLTGLLDRLEADGVLERHPNPEDRRSFLVDLTPAGRAAAAGVRAMLEDFEDALDAAVSEDDRAAFKRVMGAVTRVTSQEGP